MDDALPMVQDPSPIHTSNMLANLEDAFFQAFFATNYLLIFMQKRIIKSRAKAIRAVLRVSSK